MTTSQKHGRPKPAATAEGSLTQPTGMDKRPDTFMSPELLNAIKRRQSKKSKEESKG